MCRLFIMFLLMLPNLAWAVDIYQPDMSRGEMLYRNHCIECHNQQIHWRDDRIAQDYAGLVRQVKRWQEAIGVVWTSEEVEDVSRYLNSQYYSYK